MLVLVLLLLLLLVLLSMLPLPMLPLALLPLTPLALALLVAPAPRLRLGLLVALLLAALREDEQRVNGAQQGPRVCHSAQRARAVRRCTLRACALTP